MSHLTEQLLENLLNLELIDYLNVSASLSNQIEKLEDILSSLNNQGSKRRQIISSEDVGSNDPDMDVSIVEPCLTAKVCKESKFPSKRLLKLWLQDSNGALYTAMELRQLPLPEYPCLGLKGTSVSHGVLLLEPKNVGFPRLPDSASEEVALLEHHLLKLKARLNVS